MAAMLHLLPLSPTWVLLGVCLLFYYLYVRRRCILLCSISVPFFVFFCYLTWPFRTFKKLGIPGPKPVLNFGNFLSYKKHITNNIISGQHISTNNIISGQHSSANNTISGRTTTTQLPAVLMTTECVEAPVEYRNVPTCVCQRGKQLAADGRTCEDVDECALSPPVCGDPSVTHATCENKPGYYLCNCQSGYVMDVDRKACTLNSGGWGPWSDWGPCSKSCDLGMQSRTRVCDSPAPSFGQPTCQGSSTGVQMCAENNCPSDATERENAVFLKFKDMPAGEYPMVEAALRAKVSNLVNRYCRGRGAFPICCPEASEDQGIYEGRQPILMIGDLGLIKEITVKQFHKFNNRQDLGSILKPFAGSLFVLKDTDWKRVRGAISPTLSSSKLKQMFVLVEKCADGLVSSLTQGRRALIDMKGCNIYLFCRIFSAYAMDVISSTAFGVDIDALNNPDHPFVTHAKAIFDMNLLKMYLYIMVPPPFNYLFTLWGFTFFPKFATDFFKHTVERVMKMRQDSADNTERVDFLQLMLKAHNKHRDETANGATLGPGLSKQEIVGNSMIFWLVGYDTTANTIALTAYNLALSQEAQDRAAGEIHRVVQNRGKLDYEAVHELHYLEMCVNETLRIYPGAKRFDRVCREDADINGLHIPAGMNINFPVWVIHHDPELWPEPDKFKPERFSKEEIATRDPYAFLTFGVGPRACVGMRLAMLEIKLALAKVLEKFRFVTCEKTEDH
uniref:EGF-like domain-containing protein n=1 Tax=Branchiostoma floridae TaxID=7739 RepID=C3ZE02_BRAFL|eukprot:XP_002592947.1 hypothetical protein BRAFLDRAFT_117765 [Branchiostoma floridae]